MRLLGLFVQLHSGENLFLNPCSISARELLLISQVFYQDITDIRAADFSEKGPRVTQPNYSAGQLHVLHKFRLEYNLFNEVYIVAVLHHEDNPFVAAYTIKEAKHLLRTICKSVEVTPKLLRRQYAELHLALAELLSAPPGRSHAEDFLMRKLHGPNQENMPKDQTVFVENTEWVAYKEHVHAVLSEHDTLSSFDCKLPALPAMGEAMEFGPSFHAPGGAAAAPVAESSDWPNPHALSSASFRLEQAAEDEGGNAIDETVGNDDDSTVANTTGWTTASAWHAPSENGSAAGTTTSGWAAEGFSAAGDFVGNFDDLTTTTTDPSAHEAARCLIDVTVADVVNAKYVASELEKCMATGEIGFAFSPSLQCKINPFIFTVEAPNAAKILENKKYIRVVGERQYMCNPSAILRATAEGGTSPRVVMLRYQYKAGFKPIPLRVLTRWRKEGEVVDLVAQYAVNPALTCDLANIRVSVALPQGTDGLKLRPKGKVDEQTNTLSWIIPSLSPSSSAGKLLARFKSEKTLEELMRPATVAFSSTGASLSDVEVRLGPADAPVASVESAVVSSGRGGGGAGPARMALSVRQCERSFRAGKYAVFPGT